MLSMMTSDASARDMRPSGDSANANNPGSSSSNNNTSRSMNNLTNMGNIGSMSSMSNNHNSNFVVKSEPPMMAGPGPTMMSSNPALPPLMKPSFRPEPEGEPMEDDYHHHHHHHMGKHGNPGLTIMTNAPPMMPMATPPPSTGSSFHGDIEGEGEGNESFDDGSDKSEVAAVRAIRYAAKATQRREKRSTKSKCSPGLRSGKWTPEEEAFTNMIIHYFKKGLMNLEDGTSLRWYLAKRLNCEAMRVTKKLKGNSSIGKQIFRALEDTKENQEAIAKAAEELEVLENLFLDSLPPVHAGGSGHHHPKASNHMLTVSSNSKNSNSSNSSSSTAPNHQQHRTPSAKRPSPSRSQPRGSSIMPFHTNAMSQEESAEVAQEDVQLLLHFYVEANDGPGKDQKKRFYHQMVPHDSSSTSSSPAKRRGVRIEHLMD